MPNHITTRLTINTKDKETLEEIKEFLRNGGEEGTIDFNAITPTPPWVYQGALGSKEREIYGENNWYDWNMENWGTKWNAYGFENERNVDNILYFQTAWTCPLEVLTKLPYIFPDVEFNIQWSSEDLGNEIGEITCYNNEITNSSIPNKEWDTKRAYDFAFDMFNTEPEDYEMYYSPLYDNYKPRYTDKKVYNIFRKE